MSAPKVSVVMLLSPGREEMAARAVRAVAAQTYPNIELVAFETAQYAGRTIGYLRNIANTCATGELIAHADDDDWSHPRRIEEQVALLQASGKQCVGYRELLFWDTRWADRGSPFADPLNEAWVYCGQDPRWVAGASMLYTREAWEACPFDDAPHEDQRWWLRNAEKCFGISSLAWQHSDGGPTWMNSYDPKDPPQPRMIAQIHAGGTEQIPRAVMLRGDVWRRAAEFDAFCERTMEL